MVNSVHNHFPTPQLGGI